MGVCGDIVLAAVIIAIGVGVGAVDISTVVVEGVDVLDADVGPTLWFCPFSITITFGEVVDVVSAVVAVVDSGGNCNGGTGMLHEGASCICSGTTVFGDVVSTKVLKGIVIMEGISAAEVDVVEGGGILLGIVIM